MILIGRMGSPFVRRTAILLDLLGLDYERRPLAAIADQDELRKISPVGRVPALKIGERVLSDSVAIAMILLDKHDRNGALMPKGGEAYADAWQMLALANGATEKFVASYYERTRRPAEKVFQDWVDLCEAQARSALDALERMTGPGFLLGETMTYVDVAIATGLTFLTGVSAAVFDPERHPRLEALRQACEAQRVFRENPPQ